MHDKRNRTTRNLGDPEREDREDQAAVLFTVITLHPVQVSLSELISELALDPRDFSERDRVERAVRDLSGVGLLHRDSFVNRPDALIVPTRVAIHAHRLLTDEDDDE
jgi:hypothetical protein